ncbi:amphi-Trp domain-containing protein [Natronolimnobius baerhuensis]|uniref:Amphi-Trp domain-containing protein n=1 Tax=Natronolimnobius baerhuensis TaxID=253108 RepID=A0A202E684_9EURY|nr:amphi-Trp domain-containing protein [Natronolimnobius baerhuensis]OVE83783.1 amphi-Trp domain-containing protein [Natronolimnobius baerhuensis]
MAERTTSDETMSRADLAAYLRHLATEFEDETAAEQLNVDVGNKTVSLHPPESVDVSIDVVERSTMFRGNHETIQLELHWKPESPE